MKTQKTFWKPMGLILGFTLMASFAGCGRTSDSSAPLPGVANGIPGGLSGIPTAQCGSGRFSFSDANCLTDFSSACLRVGGVVTGTQTCKIQVADTVSTFSGVLNPDSPSGPQAGRGLLVRQGDLLTFYGTGNWGTQNTGYSSIDILNIFKIYWGTWSTFSCSKVDIDGRNDSKVGNYQGLPAGLIGAIDGAAESFFIGSRLSNYQVRNAGTLHVGMNAPVDLLDLCGGYSGTLYVTVR